MHFSDLGLSAKVLEAIVAAGYTTPTPIQEQAIPIALRGTDVLGIAQTGTGKTASFVLPMLTRLEKGRARARMPRSLILAPTRELAAQVAENFERYGTNHKLTVALLIGGVSFEEQDRLLGRGADVLIATPGRMLDHFQRGKLLLTGVEILVIDEADRMLDMGFIPDIEKICSLLPPRRQTLFFSATMPPEIQRLVSKFLNSPERVEVAPPSTTAKTITQRFCRASADPREKRQALRDLIDGQDEIKNAIIFCNRKRDVAIVYKSLSKHGYNAGELHGDMDQHQRTATLDAFRAGKITFLAASDVAARGLDIPDVSHIFNYDVPVHAEDYVHRIGRTGRAGRKGFAATLVTRLDSKMMRQLESAANEPLEWMDGFEAEGSDADDASRSDDQRSGRRNHGGRNRSRSKRNDAGSRSKSALTSTADAKTDEVSADGASAPAGTGPQPVIESWIGEDTAAGTTEGKPSPRRKRGGRGRKASGSTVNQNPSAAASDTNETESQGGRGRRRITEETSGSDLSGAAHDAGDRNQPGRSDGGRNKRTARAGSASDKGSGAAADGNTSRNRGKSDGQRDRRPAKGRDAEVVGLGDHVPAFLRRSIRDR